MTLLTAVDFDNLNHISNDTSQFVHVSWYMTGIGYIIMEKVHKWLYFKDSYISYRLLRYVQIKSVVWKV
jgi:hypothetical protein